MSKILFALALLLAGSASTANASDSMMPIEFVGEWCFEF